MESLDDRIGDVCAYVDLCRSLLEYSLSTQKHRHVSRLGAVNTVYSCRRRGERAKLSPPPEEQESDYRREFRRSGWAACIKRVYEIAPLECPKSKAQMRIIVFIQNEHSIKDVMKAQGIPDFQAPPPIPKFIDTSHALDEIPSYDSFDPAPDDFQTPLPPGRSRRSVGEMLLFAT